MRTPCQPTSTNVAPAAAQRRDDLDCQNDAGRYLRALVGPEPVLVWDHDHHLQGHAHCAGHEIVVIASRDTDHRAVVLTHDDWEAIRRADGPNRSELLRVCAIDSRDRLLSAIAMA